MGESRLSALTLMHIKYDMRIMPVNLDEIVNYFLYRPTPENDAVYQLGV